MYIKYPQSVRRKMTMTIIATACLASSFFLGISSSLHNTPASLIMAGSLSAKGDIDENGTVDYADVIVILEIVQGYRVPTVAQLKADPNGDGFLTVDDALRILSRISLQ